MAHVLREIDERHPALAELPLDAVAALEGRVQAGDGIAHVDSLPRNEIRWRVADTQAEGRLGAPGPRLPPTRPPLAFLVADDSWVNL